MGVSLLVLQTLFLSFQVENLIDHDYASKQLNTPYWYFIAEGKTPYDCIVVVFLPWSETITFNPDPKKTFGSWGTDAYKKYAELEGHAVPEQTSDL